MTRCHHLRSSFSFHITVYQTSRYKIAEIAKTLSGTRRKISALAAKIKWRVNTVLFLCFVLSGFVITILRSQGYCIECLRSAADVKVIDPESGKCCTKSGKQRRIVWCDALFTCSMFRCRHGRVRLWRLRCRVVEDVAAAADDDDDDLWIDQARRCGIADGWRVDSRRRRREQSAENREDFVGRGSVWRPSHCDTRAERTPGTDCGSTSCRSHDYYSRYLRKVVTARWNGVNSHTERRRTVRVIRSAHERISLYRVSASADFTVCSRQSIVVE